MKFIDSRSGSDGDALFFLRIHYYLYIFQTSIDPADVNVQSVQFSLF